MKSSNAHGEKIPADNFTRKFLANGEKFWRKNFAIRENFSRKIFAKSSENLGEEKGGRATIVFLPERTFMVVCGCGTGAEEEKDQMR